MRVSIVGTGYVGIVSGTCLASKGHDVVCVDIDEAKVRNINNAVPPIYEKGLEKLMLDVVPDRMRATTDLHSSVLDTDVSLIAVGTPFDGQVIDLTYVKEVSRQIGRALREKDGYHTVIVKSTVVPGTTDDVVLPILEQESGKSAGKDFGVGMNPEFLREGEAIVDFMYPDRIVLGGIDNRTRDVQEELYSAFPDVDKVRTNNKTAEMIKYTSNSLLATMISFSNEIGNLCSAIDGVDVTEVMKGVHLDKRLSPIMPDGTRITPVFTSYIEAGCGFGGSCFPKDVNALIAHGRRAGSPMRLLEAVIDVNREQPGRIIMLLKKHFPSMKDLNVSVLGLAFKPSTDDMRESPAIPIVRTLQKEGAKIRAYDPVARHEAEKIFGTNGIRYCDDLISTLEDADVVVLLTRWEEFGSVPELVSRLPRQPLFIDGRRMLDSRGFSNYEGIGLGRKA